MEPKWKSWLTPVHANPKFLLPGSGVELRREVMLKNCSRVDVPAIKTSKFDTIDGGETAGGLVITGEGKGYHYGSGAEAGL